MTGSESQAVADAWSLATDKDVAAAIDCPGDYESEEVLAIIRREAERRGLGPADTIDGAGTLARRSVLHDAAYATISKARRHPFVSAALLAFSYSLLRLVLIKTIGLLGLVGALAPFLVFQLCVGVVVWPIRSQARVWLVSLSFVFTNWLLTFAVGGLLNGFGPAVYSPGWLALFASLLTLWVVSAGPLSMILVYRNRRWPIFPSGACSQCGYCLTGNVSGICPECGLRIADLGN